jgi:S-DNA-T family DNA segregation ATPase FtsK/SpoIIIE
MYCLDFGGGALSGLADLPHVGGVAGRQDTAAVRRTVAEVAALLARRERRFAELKVESMAQYRRLRRSVPTNSGRLTTDSAPLRPLAADGPADPHGDVFLMIDGWSTVRTDYDELEFTLTDIATRGLAYGIHLVAAAMRWNDFRPSIRDLFGTRLELRLGEPGDSEIDRRRAADIPRIPGRGLTTDRLHMLIGLPSVRASFGPEPADLVKAVAGEWPGQPAPPVRLLPDVLPYEGLADDRDPARPLALPIGIAEDDLAVVRLDFAAEPHFLLFGDAECGKTTFLRTLAHTLVERFRPEQARIMLVDYRRGLLGAINSDHLIGYGTGAKQALELMESAAAYMQRRLPGPDITPDELRTRSWWTGPELFVLVDDYDLVATGPVNPLQPLLEYLAQARDIGLHLVLARRTGGASRAMYEPVIQRIRELSGPGLVMSGDRDEGPLLGNVRPARMPPGRGRLVSRREGTRLVQLAQLQVAQLQVAQLQVAQLQVAQLPLAHPGNGQDPAGGADE